MNARASYDDRQCDLAVLVRCPQCGRESYRSQPPRAMLQFSVPECADCLKIAPCPDPALGPASPR